MTSAGSASSGARRAAAWLVHLFTASAGVVGLFALRAIYRHDFVLAFWLMAVAIVIDALDGSLARLARVKEVVPRLDGALLDNLLDYLNYVVVPAFLVLVSDLLPAAWRGGAAGCMVLASAYQFAQRDAKTGDHFFKGFPSYWNIVVFYFFAWRTPPPFNLVAVLALAAGVFIPVKCVYPSRLDHLSRKRWVRHGMLAATIIWGAAALLTLWIYPATSWLLMDVSVAYILLYFAISVYRTLCPLSQEPPRQR
ncbi:CDP-alcohol phosphatidyltransferase family protein [bacterium]|nr:CDP-alcohol phosphatidyltransferase family protein [bacterium]